MLKLIKHIVINIALLTIVLISFSFLLTAQNSEEIALQFFEDENYIEALPFYKELNVLYPNDYTIQYNYGVCLSETNNFGNKARKLLLQASQSDVPSKVFFYIAKNYHALNDYETANIYYTRFDNNAKNKAKRALDFIQIWEKCKLNINPFVQQDEKLVETKQDTLVDSEKENPQPIINNSASKTINTQQYDIDSILSVKQSQNQINDSLNNVDSSIDIQNDSIIDELKIRNIKEEVEENLVEEPKSVDIPTELLDTTFNFILNSGIYYQQIDQFRTAKGKSFFIEAWKSSDKLKTLLIDIDLLRNEYKQSQSQTEKATISNKVLALEMETIQLKSNSDKNLLNARSEEIKYWNNAVGNELNKLNIENDSIKQAKIVIEDIVLDKVEVITPDSIANTPDSLTVIEKPVNEQVTNIVYKIQIGAYSKGLPEYIDRLYKKLSVLRKIESYTDDRGIVVYTIGELTSFENAIKLQNQIRQEGVKDAFIVAYNNGKRITLKEAKEITNNE